MYTDEQLLKLEAEEFLSSNSKLYRYIYNKALEDLQKMIDDEYLDGDYGDYHEVEKIARMIEQLKK